MDPNPKKIFYTQCVTELAAKVIVNRLELYHTGRGLRRYDGVAHLNLHPKARALLNEIIEIQCAVANEENKRRLAQKAAIRDAARDTLRLGAVPHLALFLASGANGEPREMAISLKEGVIPVVRIDGVNHEPEDRGEFVPPLPVFRGADVTPLSLRFLAARTLAGSIHLMDASSRRNIVMALFPGVKHAALRRKREEMEAEVKEEVQDVQV